MTNHIKHIHARQILDSRGNPTIEVEVITNNNITGRAAVPSGASTGRYEAVELRDTHLPAYLGKGVQQAIKHVKEILGPALIGKSIFDQIMLDKLLIDLDGTKNKARLGGNALLGISIAVAKAAAKTEGIPLFRYLGSPNAHLMPRPMINIYNGGAHAINTVDIQEFMIIPIRADTFSTALRIGTEIFHHLGSILTHKRLPTSVGDEGGYAASFPCNEAVMELLLQATERAGYRPGEDIAFALDAAASSFYDPITKNYHFKKSTGQRLNASELVSFWKSWIQQYPIISIEDGMAEDDWQGWEELTTTLGKQAQLVGDDLFVTQVDRLQQGIERKVANAILIKANQVGTLTETIDTIKLAQKSGYNTIISHRSGETEDTFIADLSVAWDAGQIKTGSVVRTDRTAKYNQLLRIEEMLGEQACFATPIFRQNH